MLVGRDSTIDRQIAMSDAPAPFVSVVVPAHNRSRLLEACLLTLAAQKYDEGRWEVIVVDDGSSDDTQPIVASASGTMPLRCVRHDERQGSGPARNTGLALAHGDIVLFLDSDTLAPPWLLAEHARSHAGRRCFVDGPAVTVRGDRPAGSWPFDALWVRALAGLDVAGAEFVTVNVSCRRDEVLAAGGFDAGFGPRYGWEDTELGVRLRRCGVERVKNRRAFVLHRSVRGYDWWDRGRKQREAGENAAYFLAKHPTREVARLVRGRPALARALAACGLDAERVAHACVGRRLRSPLSWALRQAYEIQQYERGLQHGRRLIDGHRESRREPA
jgi:glycosyltransferase involved in cell wall biosynthesis